MVQQLDKQDIWALIEYKLAVSKVLGIRTANPELKKELDAIDRAAQRRFAIRAGVHTEQGA